MVSSEFRVNHRAASESLLRAAAEDVSFKEVCADLEKAEYFEREAMRHVDTPRQRALGLGLLHAIDLMRAVTETEFGR